MDARADFSESSIGHFNGVNFSDVMQEADFENLISALRGTTVDPIEKFCLDYNCNHFTDTCTALQLAPISYGGNGAGSGAGANQNLDLIWNQKEDNLKVYEVSGDDDPSETVRTSNPETPARTRSDSIKGDRKRTLISERKRRNGMKENLYALRSLVPNITKMDKASIVEDAARYIQELQTQARNLRAEISAIEATKNQKTSSKKSKKIHHVQDSFPVPKNISKFDMFQVDEKGYYVRLVCNKGQSVAVSIHKALESIARFQVQTLNLETTGDNFDLTFTLNVTMRELDIKMPNLKLWLADAFLNQGFEFSTHPSPLNQNHK